MSEIDEKEKVLENYLKELKSVAVAFSAGVDSTFLLKKAKQVLGDNVIAITIKSCFVPKRELNEAIDFCKKENIKHIIIESDVLNVKEIAKNPKNRCYFCKKELFKKMIQIAKDNGMNELVEGSNMNDMDDYRPGMKAITELKIKSPLKYAKLYKQEIRLLSNKLELPTWDKPSFACLASRFVYGETITEEKLEMVDKAEQLLLDMGLKQMRVRIHNDMARIEVMPNCIELIAKEENREKISKAFKEYGFSYVALDLEGYKTGNMNKFKKGK